jgi:hypothetical protein
MTSTSTATSGTDAIDPRLVVVKQEPFNAEAPLAQQIGGYANNAIQVVPVTVA